MILVVLRIMYLLLTLVLRKLSFLEMSLFILRRLYIIVTFLLCTDGFI